MSGEAPLFQTASQEKVLVVVNLPDSGPVIAGSQPRYQIGDTLNVSCTSPNSRPAAKLRYILVYGAGWSIVVIVTGLSL